MSHFRSGTLTWDQTDLYSFTFSGQQSYRASYLSNPAVGSVALVGTLNFGDGTWASLYIKVLSLDTATDILVGEITDASGNPISHTYPSVVANYEAFFASNARIATNDEFNQTGYRSETIVNAGILNEAPVSSVPAVVQVADNAVFTYQLAAVDPDGDSLTFRVGDRSEFIGSGSGPVAPAGATVSSTGLLTWDVRDSIASVTPGQLYTMTAMISDGLTSTPIDFLLQIVDTASNQAPAFTLVPPAQTLGVGTTVNLAVQASDPNGNLTNIQVLNPPAGMTTDFHADHGELHIDFTPTTPGDYVVTIQATDAGGLTAQTSITFTVPANAAPVATGDGYTTVEDTPLAVDTGGLLANDSDGEGDAFTAALVAGPSNGTLELNPDGTFTYTPNADFAGQDSFTYMASDATGDSAPATVTIDVTAVDDAPTHVVPAAQAIDEDNALLFQVADGNAISLGDVDAGAADLTTMLSIEDGALSVGAVMAGLTVGGDGTNILTLTGTVAEINDALDGLTYTPPTNANGARTLTITTNDAGASPPAETIDSVSIAIAAVEDAGVARDDAIATFENAVATGNVFVDNGNGADADPEGLTVAAVNGVADSLGQPVLLASGALLTLNEDGSYSYDPNGAFDELAEPGSGASNVSANDSFTYALDGGGTATVTVTVNGVDTDDRLLGTPFGDEMVGGRGTDSFDGAAGDDLLSGGYGNDEIRGGEGTDELKGQPGDDRLFGNQGTDRLFGGNDLDWLYGGYGDDLVRGAYGDDILRGGRGADRMFGDQGDDILLGGADDDWMDGGTGHDRLSGGDGKDTLIGRGGDDILSGDDGDDLILGGMGNDRLDGGGGRDTLRGARGDDTLTGRGDDDSLSGYHGDDLLFGDAGADLLDGGNGNDMIRGGIGDDHLTGERGNDWLAGGEGDDVLRGGRGADSLRGGAGNDSLKGGSGADGFSFVAPLDVAGVDAILDFAAADDTIFLDGGVFGEIDGGAIGDAFHSGTEAADAGHRILHDVATGNIFYDADGSGAEAAILFATVAPGTVLTGADFVVI